MCQGSFAVENQFFIQQRKFKSFLGVKEREEEIKKLEEKRKLLENYYKKKLEEKEKKQKVDQIKEGAKDLGAKNKSVEDTKRNKEKEP